MGRSETPLKRRWGRWLVALLAGALLLAWCSTEQEAPAPSPPPVTVEVQPDLPPPLLPAQVEPADAAVDAAVMLHDAGRARSSAPPAPDIEAYMRRWREALAPLFRPSFSEKSRPELLRAMPRPPQPEPDAGTEPCKARVERLLFNPRARVDLVVVIDTSGSMWRALPKVADWLGQLEYEINRGGNDTQLLVVAEQRDLGPRVRVDAGAFDLVVNSSDSLDVLLEGAKPGKNRWVDALRPAADLHIVVVTDDAAQGEGPAYVARLTELLGEGRFSVHVLGGLETPRSVLTADQPSVAATCSGEGVRGLNPGRAYQDAARLTGGLRASLCYESSRQGLASALLRVKSQGVPCAWLLQMPGQRVERIDAVGPRQPSTGLVYERVLSNCFSTRRSYRLEGSLLVLCEDTCAALKQEGFDAVEVKLECSE